MHLVGWWWSPLLCRNTLMAPWTCTVITCSCGHLHYPIFPMKCWQHRFKLPRSELCVSKNTIQHSFESLECYTGNWSNISMHNSIAELALTTTKRSIHLYQRNNRRQEREKAGMHIARLFTFSTVGPFTSWYILIVYILIILNSRSIYNIFVQLRIHYLPYI